VLTIKAIEAARPGPQARKLFDGQGLYLEVRPNGSRLWRLKYRVGGVEKRISFGAYPEVSLREARERRDEARRLLRDGRDPSVERQAARVGARTDTLETVAREWYGRWRQDKAESYHAVVWRALERDVFPRLGQVPVGELEPVTILPVLRAVEARGAIETAHRIKGYLGLVCRYAVATGRAVRDPTADLRGALTPVSAEHFAAITEPAAFGALLRAIDGYQGQPATLFALRLAPLVVLRPGELRHAAWEEIDLETATWIVPAARMKLRRDHVVPLARQAVAVLREARPHARGRLVFPALRGRDRPLSENTLNAAFRRMGYTTGEVTAHGFRASFRTMGAEVLGFRAELLEHQLAHAVRDPLGRAYNRTQFLEERRSMLQAWADWCDAIKRPDRADESSTPGDPPSR
jgi:integrase